MPKGLLRIDIKTIWREERRVTKDQVRKMSEYNYKLLQTLLSTVNNAVVYFDDGAAECIHWMNAVDKIFSAGALEIRSLSNTKVFIFLSMIVDL